MSANTTNTFKSRLDKFGQNQDIGYNFNDNYRCILPHCTYNAVIGAVRQFRYIFICPQKTHKNPLLMINTEFLVAGVC